VYRSYHLMLCVVLVTKHVLGQKLALLHAIASEEVAQTMEP